MTEAEIRQYILTTFAGVTEEAAMDAFFFSYNPDGTAPPDHRLPWATLVTTDAHDPYSDLGRPGVFRLNLGLSKATFQALFGALPPPADPTDPAARYTPAPGYDYTALDQLLPHPVYGRLHWVCILSPSAATFTTQVQPLLAEAYARAVRTHATQAAHRA